MALKDLLEKSSIFNTKQGISETRVKAQLNNLRNLISFFRMYPDIYVDFVKGEECNFKFYTYQRIFLRIVMRHRYVFSTFARAYSKSFLSMMALILKATFYPGAALFVNFIFKYV